MAESTLLLDQGNSRLKWCVAVAGTLQTDHSGALAGTDLAGFEQVVRDVAPGRIYLSSVADTGRAEALLERARQVSGCEVVRLRSTPSCNGVVNVYQEAAALGVDRWMAILGGVERHGMPLVVVDVGTATTLDAVDHGGRHLGGWILPGPVTMAEALLGGTAIASSGLKDGCWSPGQDTDSAIAGGILAAQAGAVERFVRRVTADCGALPKVVFCGGGGEALLEGILKGAPDLQPRFVLDPWLVFAGMLVATEGGSSRNNPCSES